MQRAARVVTLSLFVLAGCALGQAQVTNFQHIILVVQENRTPDNLFQGLCLPPYGSASACGTGANQFNIQSYGYDVNGNQIPLNPVPLGNPWDPPHVHSSFEVMCNPNRTTYYPCTQNTRLPTTGCPTACSFEYVDPNSTPTIYPYLYMAQNFGWANWMFETNQGPSTPAHQFLFSGTSAVSAAADAQATFVAENPTYLGCLAPLGATYLMIQPASAPVETKLINNPLGTSCFDHATMASLLEQQGLTWSYYTVGDAKTDVATNIWTAPNWIQEICQPNSTYTECMGQDWINNVYLNPADVLVHAQNTCDLKNMSWVIPTGQDSDHPSGVVNYPNNGGPAWVAAVVNAVAGSSCMDVVNGVEVPYWKDTAIIVVWDDWGGFYDHVLPTFLSAPNAGQGDYQLGFRVPLIFISAYTKPMIDNNNQYDFGSILRFAEQNFDIPEGALGFADQRATTDLTSFYNLQQTPMNFWVPTNVPVDFYLHDKRPRTAPDTD